MCGIAGWVCFGKQLPVEGTAAKLLASLEERGRIASGMAWAPDWGRKAGFLKHCISGSQLPELEQSKPYMDQVNAAKMCILHTRFPTKGEPSNQKNNHPVFRTNGKYMVVHNGGIYNDDVIFEKLKLERECEVDTEALVALLDSGSEPEKSVELLGKTTGSFAIAALPAKNIDHILLARHVSPIIWLYDSYASILYFASTVKALCMIFDDRVDERAVRLGIKQPRMIMPSEFNDDSYWIITKDGVVADGKIKFDSAWYRVYDATKHAIYRRKQSWNTKTQRWEFENGEAVPERPRTWMDQNNNAPHGHNYSTPLPLPAEAGLSRGSTNKLIEVFYSTTAMSTEVGVWEKEKLHLRSCKGFHTPPLAGMYEQMYKFPSFTFPDVKSTSVGDTLVMCPACLLYSYARQFVNLGFKCPECKTQLIEPKELRPLSEAERHVRGGEVHQTDFGGNGV